MEVTAETTGKIVGEREDRIIDSKIQARRAPYTKVRFQPVMHRAVRHPTELYPLPPPTSEAPGEETGRLG